jgi:hypothetical protein
LLPANLRRKKETPDKDDILLVLVDLADLAGEGEMVCGDAMDPLERGVVGMAAGGGDEDSTVTVLPFIFAAAPFIFAVTAAAAAFLLALIFLLDFFLVDLLGLRLLPSLTFMFMFMSPDLGDNPRRRRGCGCGCVICSIIIVSYL